jgi:group I intron endonuclease
MGFIYLVTNLLSGKYYVGQHRGRDLQRYLTKNVQDALRGYDNKPYLNHAIRKYGAGAFVIQALAVSDGPLDDLERLWIVALAARELGYNIAVGGNSGTAGWNRGVPFSEATKARMRKPHRFTLQSKAAMKANMSAVRKGVPKSAEHRAAIARGLRKRAA